MLAPYRWLKCSSSDGLSQFVRTIYRVSSPTLSSFFSMIYINVMVLFCSCHFTGSSSELSFLLHLIPATLFFFIICTLRGW